MNVGFHSVLFFSAVVFDIGCLCYYVAADQPDQQHKSDKNTNVYLVGGRDDHRTLHTFTVTFFLKFDMCTV